jgi:hypothetical protein
MAKIPFNDYIIALLSPIAWFVLMSDNDGAQTPLFLALSKQIDGVSGKYFRFF